MSTRKTIRFKKTEKYRAAVGIVRRLHEARHEAYLVGGCVRDLLMKRTPQDFDVATSAKPEEVSRLFRRTIPVGVKFGVQLVLIKGVPYEVATFRTDQAYKDGRRPEGVIFSNPKEDALRRDFTVNSLFFDPKQNRVIDFCSGQKDLSACVIRAIGEPRRRFSEDRLRMLRAIRFAATLEFAIEPKTFRAIQKEAKAITEVSLERIRDELVKLLTGPHPGKGLALLDASGLLPHILPEVSKMKGVQQPPEFHPEGDVFVHTKLLLDKLPSTSAVLIFGALLHDVGKPPTFKVKERIRFDGHDVVGKRMAEKICRRLHFSNAEGQAIVEIVGNHMRFKDVKLMRVSTLKRFLARPTLAEEMKLHRADCQVSHGDLSNWRFLRRKQKEFSIREIRPKPLLRGQDLLALGFQTSPLIGVILKAVEERQLEGELTAKAQALAWVKESFSPGNGDIR